MKSSDVLWFYYAISFDKYLAQPDRQYYIVTSRNSIYLICIYVYMYLQLFAVTYFIPCEL